MRIFFCEGVDSDHVDLLMWTDTMCDVCWPWGSKAQLSLNTAGNQTGNGHNLWGHFDGRMEVIYSGSDEGYFGPKYNFLAPKSGRGGSFWKLYYKLAGWGMRDIVQPERRFKQWSRGQLGKKSSGFGGVWRLWCVTEAQVEVGSVQFRWRRTCKETKVKEARWDRGSEREVVSFLSV